MAFGKTEMINHVALNASLTKVDAQKAVEAVFSGIMASLKSGEEVRFIGFGSFVVQKAAARQGRNPRTNEVIQIAASNRPTFRAGSELKNAVNGKEGSDKKSSADSKKAKEAPKKK